MRTLIKLLLLPLLAYAGGMAYLWYEVKNGADEAIKAAAPFADIRYDSVHLSPLGDEVGLNNLVIKAQMTQDEFRIEQLHVSGPYPGFFLLESHNLSNGEPPEKMGVRISRLKVDLDSELFTMLEQMQQQTAQTNAGDPQTMLFDLDALGCGDKESFTIEDYRNMGIGVSILDITADLAFNDALNRMQMRSDISIEGLYSLGTAFEFDLGPKGKMDPEMFGSSLPRASINYRDTGYHTLRNDYCAKLNGSDVEDYINRNLALINRETGLALSEKATTVYKKFKREGGNMDIQLNPSSNLELNSLKYYKAADIIDMLGLSIDIDGTQLNFIQASDKAMAPIPTAEDKTPQPEPVIDPRALPRSTAGNIHTEAEPVATEPAYKTVKVKDAGKHINKQVEITTMEGKVRSGLLERVSDNRLYLVMKLRAGTLTYPVETDNISKLRVLN